MKDSNKHFLKRTVQILVVISVILNFLFAASIVFDKDVSQNSIKPKSKNIDKKKQNMPGRWRSLQSNTQRNKLTAQQKEAIKQLESIGYMSGSEPAPENKGVVVFNKNLVYNGLNLYISGHAPEAILTDLEGNELHKWSCDFWDIWPEYEIPNTFNSHNHEFWRRVHLLENGDLLAIFEGIGLIKLDKDSNLLWAFRGKAHHDIWVDTDNTIYVLTRKGRINPKYIDGPAFLEDFITILSPNGQVIREVSILKSFGTSLYGPVLKDIAWTGDIFHTNTINILDGRLSHKSSAFKKGNALICIRNLDIICIIDLEAEKVVWALSGLWSKQHESIILENENMLIFDNLGNNGKSRIIEFDPFSQEIKWVYAGSQKRPLFSSDCGSCLRLPNGNTLICESNSGRAIEVTRDKTIVWEFISPHRAGKNDELIATLFEVIRLSPDLPLSWLNKTPNIE